jgi:hypothetical protein
VIRLSGRHAKLRRQGYRKREDEDGLDRFANRQPERTWCRLGGGGDYGALTTVNDVAPASTASHAERGCRTPAISTRDRNRPDATMCRGRPPRPSRRLR